MNGAAVTNRLQNSFKIACPDHRIIEILGLRPSNRLPVFVLQTGCLSSSFKQVACLRPSNRFPVFVLQTGCLSSSFKQVACIRPSNRLPVSYYKAISSLIKQILIIFLNCSIYYKTKES